MKTWSKGKIFKTVWFSLVVVFFVWNWTTFQSRHLPEDTCLTTKNLLVTETDDQITFQPASANSNVEVIFFRGA